MGAAAQLHDDLIDRCISGDGAAWEALHREYRHQALAFLRRLGVRPREAEDACQEVFLQIFRYLDRFERRADFRTWLYKLCITQAGRLRRRAVLLRPLTWLRGDDSTFPELEWGRRLARDGRPAAHARLRDGLLATLGTLAALSYVNFGFFHFGAFIHEHEWTHYYLGSKYSNELSYDGLYECLSVADVDAGLRRRVELRKIRNLHTNVLETTTAILAHPERCTARFTEARWQAFERDAAFFRARQSPQRWDRVQVDHGYNATPVWNALGSALTNLAPASTTQLHALALFDPLYLVAMIAVVWWAFGWRVLSVALLVFGTNFPSRFYWTGGAFMRWDWLFFLVAGVCCLRKGKPLLAGAALCCSASLRVFPVFVFVGPLLALGWRVWERRRWEPFALRLFAGAAAAGVLLVLVSLPFTGAAGYRRFAENTRKHEGTYMSNNMGLQTVLAWRPDGVGRVLNDDRLIEPWSKVKEGRQAAFRQARPLSCAHGRRISRPARPGRPSRRIVGGGGAQSGAHRRLCGAHLLLLRVHHRAGTPVARARGGGAVAAHAHGLHRDHRLGSPARDVHLVRRANF